LAGIRTFCRELQVAPENPRLINEFNDSKINFYNNEKTHVTEWATTRPSRHLFETFSALNHLQTQFDNFQAQLKSEIFKLQQKVNF